MTPDQFLAALRAEGLNVIEVGSWRTRSRTGPGRPWGPVHGAMTHHTVTRGTKASVDICYNGYAGLPGPLSQVMIAKNGDVYLLSAGRCNHAGGGDPNVLQAVKDERYNDRPPKPTVGNATGVDGNARFYGAECENMGDGKDPWPEEQVEAIVRFNAAVLRFYGWTEKSAIDHAEWSRDKSDPAGPGMPTAPARRARIKERLAHPPSWNPPTSGTPVTYTKPDRLLVRRAEDITLQENVPVTIYWTEEFPDDANQHGNGGKTVATNRLYNGVIHLKITGLGMNEFIEVYAAEEDANGNRTGNSPMGRKIWGVAEGFHELSEPTPVHGHVTNRLVFEVVSRASGPVTIDEAWLSLHTDPLS